MTVKGLLGILWNMNDQFTKPYWFRHLQSVRLCTLITEDEAAQWKPELVYSHRSNNKGKWKKKKKFRRQTLNWTNRFESTSQHKEKETFYIFALQDLHKQVTSQVGTECGLSREKHTVWKEMMSVMLLIAGLVSSP